MISDKQKNIIFASVIIFSIRQWQKLDTYSRLITMTHTRPIGMDVEIRLCTGD